MKRMKIEVLYPELNHLYGDNGNLSYLETKLKKMGVPYEVTETHLNDEPAFVNQEVDFLYVGPATESDQRLQAEALQPYKDALKERISSEYVTLMTGNAFELLGSFVEEENGERFPCLDLIPTCAKRFTRLRYNDLSVGTWQGLEITGFKNQLSHSYVMEGKEPPKGFLSMQCGSGWNPGEKQEGFSENWFFATYLIGPILPLNPGFSEIILKHLCPEIQEIPELPFEMEAYRLRITELKSK